MIRLALFDYGAGNLHSLQKGLEAGGASVAVTTDWDVALSLDGLVLPGVGSFGAATAALSGSEARIRSALAGGLPCLGICLGMQLLFEGSEEGAGAGIGFIPGGVRRLGARVVPQMGWNDVTPVAPEGDPEGSGEDPLFQGLRTFPAYYANSYVCVPADDGAVVARTEYEGTFFPAAVRRARCWGVQFHPEKSSRGGLRLLGNFLDEVAGGLR